MALGLHGHPCTPVSALRPLLPTGRATRDPADEATVQPPQQAAPPRGSPRQPGLPEDPGVSDPSVVSTIVCAVLGPRGVRIVFHSMQRALDTSQRWLNRHLSERQADEARRRVVAITQQLWPRPPDIRPQLARLQRVLGLTDSTREGGGPEVYRTMVTVGSLEELLVVVGSRGEEVVTQAWQALGVFLLQHPALGWLQDAAGTVRQDATDAAGTGRPDTTEAAGTVTPDTTSSAEMVTPDTTSSAEMVASDTTSSAEMVAPGSTKSAEMVTPDTTNSAEVVALDSIKSAEMVAPDMPSSAGMVAPDSTEAAEMVTPDSTEAAEPPDTAPPDPQP
nr:uncharacterized protein LOC110359822 isoform X4 [Columba livia]